MKEESDRLGRARASVIEGAMSLLWEGYCTHAWGFDEVRKLTRPLGPVSAPHDEEC